MIGRIEQEKRENKTLSEYACRSSESRGRNFPQEKCSIRTDFQRDRDRVIHSKAFRRLMHKTQVFLAPEGDHFRTRLTHTIEVSQIARTISRALDLNEDLTEAIAMGHDLGHTPFGHRGEKSLAAVYPGGFKHNVQSLRVVDVLEGDRDRGGLNLTAEVRDGILNHTGNTKPITLEGQVMKISDRIAYINHDIDDALRSAVIREEDLPSDCIAYLGDSHRKRIDTMVKDVIKNSWGKDVITMSHECWGHMDALRTYMFENVYLSPCVRETEQMQKVREVVKTLYEYYRDNSSELPDEMGDIVENDGIECAAKDFVAGMTDRYALNRYESIIADR